MEFISNPAIMQQAAKSYLMKEKSIGFVPTMGALHEGHLSVIRRCRDENDLSVVSIFVNPLQFSPSEDFGRYPRKLESDVEKLREIEIDTLFCPNIEDIYPPRYSTYITVEGLSDKLCGFFRPGHFRGVSTIVAKLFHIIKPTRAYFGEKDYQQSLIVRRLVKDLNLDIEIIICSTVREKSGLAISSRNQYLSTEERESATIIYKTLSKAEEMLYRGTNFEKTKSFMEQKLATDPLIKEIQYASIYDPETLDDISSFNIYDKKVVLLAVALFIGNVRLIDNKLIEIEKNPLT